MADDQHELPELDPDVASFVAAYEAETARDEAQVEAALEEVTAKIGAGATGAGLSLSTKVGIAGVVAGVVGVVALLSTGPQRQPPRRETPVAAEEESEARTEPEPAPEEDERDAEPEAVPVAAEASQPEPSEAEGEPEDRDVEVSEPAAPKKRPAKPKKPERVDDRGDDDSLMAELALLQRTRRALRDGRAEDALKAVGQHRREFPSGRLAEERDATEISALCALGRGDEARRKAAAFERAHPKANRDLLGDCE